MKKKLLLGLVAVFVIAGGVAALSAYEAHIINVTAHIENALYVHPDQIAFGTVFPQEYLLRDFTVELSTSFQAQSRLDDVTYVIKQKPKCECDAWDPASPELCPLGQYLPVDYATHECPTDYTEMESLCPFLSKMDGDPGDGNDTGHASYFVDPDGTPNSGDEYCEQPTRIDNTLAFSPGGWAGWSCPVGTHVVGGGVNAGATITFQGPAKPGEPMYPVYPHYTYTPPETGWVVQNDNDNETISYYVLCLANIPDATGYLSVSYPDVIDLWKVDLKVPPVDGYVGQDWPEGCPTVPTNDLDYGCDLWIEVTGFSVK